MDPNKEIDDLEEIEESEGPELGDNDEEFEPELDDSDSDVKNIMDDNEPDEEAVGNEIVEDIDDDASIYDANDSDIMEEEEDDDANIDEENALEDSIVKNTDNKKSKSKKTKQNIPISSQYSSDYDNDDDEDDDEDDENYLQKFSREINKQYIEREHPEGVFHNYNEISTLSKIIRDKNNNIIDPLHRTIPFLTKYEKTRIIGQRAKQINSCAKPFVNVPQHIIDGYIIAELELKQKKIPFIIKRPIPGGGSEYWNVKDLELI
jgi:DNA-directed RNA polymerase I, II, and III subunit RPABC2